MTVFSTARTHARHGPTLRSRCDLYIHEHQHLIALDPGVDGSGAALWNLRLNTTVPQHVAVWNPPRSMDWESRVIWLGDKLNTWLTDRTLVVCEMMEYQASAKRSLAWKRGDLQKTVYLIGHWSGMAYNGWPGVHFLPVPVRDWKGQLPKAVVASRVRSILTLRTIEELGMSKNSHDWDAVGLGLWALGHMREGRRG